MQQSLSRLIRLFCFLLLPAGASLLNASDSQPEDINAILRHAAYNSPEMIAAQLNIAESNADRFRGIITYLPEIDLDYQAGGYHEIRDSIKDSDATRVGGSYSLTATHPVYHWGGVSSLRQQAYANESLKKYEAMLVFAQLIQSLRTDYLDLIAQKSALNILEEETQITENAFEKSQLMAEQGQISSSELDQTDIELRNRKLKLSYEKNQFGRNLIRFRNKAGLEELTKEQIPTDTNMPIFDIQTLKKEYQIFIEQEFTDSLPSHIAEEQLKTIEHQLVITNAEQLPTLNFRGGMSQQPVTVNNSYELQTIFFIGFGGNWNLFDRAETSTNKRSLMLRKRQVKTALMIARDRIFAEGLYNLELLESNLEALSLKEEQLAIAEDTLEIAQMNLEKGVINNEEFEDKRLSKLEIEHELLENKVNLLKSYYNVIGTLFEDPALNYFDPDKDTL